MTRANDEAWDRYFSKTATLAQINNKGFAYAGADDLKLYGQREPRLMAKLDTLSERPQSFKQNDLNILPVQNGLYFIYKDPENKLYFQFNSALEDVPLEEFGSSIDLQSFDSFNNAGSITSESQVIDFAFLSSLLHHFCNCRHLHLTIRGRLYSGKFALAFPYGQSLDINNVQIEVDSGYESSDSIILIEAKIGRRDNFNIRQLVYPYMQWSQRSQKKIRPIFLTYSNGEYLLTEFAVGSTFGDLEIISNRAFVINDSPRAVVHLPTLLSSIPVTGEPPGIPFPQADDMNKVVDLIELLSQGSAGKNVIAEFFEFEERQADYYANAAAYLGFAQRDKNVGGFVLTQAGHEFLALTARTRRTRVLLQKMLKIPSLRDCIQLLQQEQYHLDKVSQPSIKNVIAEKSGMSLQANTLTRRAGTVRKWLDWLLKNVSFTN